MRFRLRQLLPARAADAALLLLVLLAAYWPLATGIAMMKWDLTGMWLPWRFFVTESLKEGHWPLWNAYTNLGFPQMGDPGTWYPVSWLIGALHRYDMAAAHAEFLLHTWIAGLGMSVLAQTLGRSRTAGLVVGVAYMLSGFFVGNAQHLGWLVSAAWLPWAATAFVQTRHTSGWLNPVALGGALFLLLSGGYPGLFICTAYLLTAWGLWYSGRLALGRDWATARQWLLRLALGAGVFLACSAVVLAASFELSPHLVRGGGLRFDNASWGTLNGSFPPKALISMLFPFAVAANEVAIWGEDFSLLNVYFGLVPLVLAVWVGFRRGTPVQVRLWGVVAVLAMLTAMANQFPLRRWLYDVVPFMDQFRFPAIFRLFAVLGLLLMAAYALDLLRQQRPRRVGLWLIFSGLGLAVVATWLTHGHLPPFSLSWDEFLQATPVRERIGIQAALQALVLLAAGAWGLLAKKHLFPVLAVLLCLDLVVAVRLNLYATVAEARPTAPTNAAIGLLPYAFPLPANDRPIGTITEGELQGALPGLNANLGTLHRLPGSDGGSPYALKMADSARKSGGYDKILRLPLLALVDASGNPLPSEIQPTAATPNHFTFNVSSTTGGTLAFAQYAYPGWQVVIDKKIYTPDIFLTSYQSVYLPAGHHTVTWQFSPRWLYPWLGLSLGAWLLTLVVLLWGKIKGSTDRKKWLIIICLSACLGAVSAAVEGAARAKGKREVVVLANPGVSTYCLTPTPPADPGAVWLPFALRSDLTSLLTRINATPGPVRIVQQGRPMFAQLRLALPDSRPFVTEDTALNGYAAFTLHPDSVPGARRYARLLWQSGATTLAPDQFSPAFEQPVSTVFPRPEKGHFVVAARARLASRPGPLLVLVIKRGDSALVWQAQPADAFLPAPDKDGWHYGHWEVALTQPLLPTDRVQSYVWNNTGSPAEVADIRLLWVREAE